MSTTFSTLDVIRNHRLNQTSGLFSGVTKIAEDTYHGVPPDSELATIAKNTPKSISGGISGSTSLVSPPKPVTPAPVHDLPYGSPGLGLDAGTRTDGTLMTPPIPTGPGVTGITEGFNAAVDREKVIAGDQAYNAQRFPAGSNGVTPEMIAQFRRRTGSNYNPNSRMDQHNMQLLASGGQTVNAQQFRKATPTFLAKTAAINSIKVFLGITKTAAPDARDMVDMNSTGGKAGDFISPLTWGGERAGRSTAMADAAGMDTSFNLRHPGTSSMGYTLGGQLLGGVGGALLGAGAGAGLRTMRGEDAVDGLAPGAVGGSLVGMVGGGIGGYILSALRRREEMRKVNDEYDRANESGDLRPKSPNFSMLSALLLPYRGAHRTGQLEAVNAMRGGKSIDEAHGSGRDALYAGAHAPYVGDLIGMPHGWAQNIRTQLADKQGRGRIKNADDLETETDEPTDEADRADREANPSISDRFSGAASKVKSDFLRNLLASMAVGGAMGARRGVVENAPTQDTLMAIGAGAGLGGVVGLPIWSLGSAIDGFHSPPKKTAAFADGMISKYVLPRAGMFLQNAGTNVKWVGQHIGRVFGGAKPPSLAAINTLFNRKYQKLQSVFAKQPMSKQLAYGAAKRGAGYATGTAVGAGTAAAAINGFSGTINDRKKEEIGKAIGSARNTIHTAMSDPATRLKLGLSALFAPGTATSHIDDLLSKIQANATA